LDFQHSIVTMRIPFAYNSTSIDIPNRCFATHLNKEIKVEKCVSTLVHTEVLQELTSPDKRKGEAPKQELNSIVFMDAK
jgi:hypothetical protein